MDWDTPIPEEAKQLTADDWGENLYRLARTDKKKAFETYSKYYLGTTGQVYWSDTHQLAGNFDSYRKAVQKQQGTEMITEVYVKRDAFVPLMTEARKDFLEHNVDMTYGTIRFIEKRYRDVSPPGRRSNPSASCATCTSSTPTRASKKPPRISAGSSTAAPIQYGGRYYLTYHRWVERRQIEACYPQFVEFLRLKKKYDPDERFQSNWYRQYKRMFSDQVDGCGRTFRDYTGTHDRQRRRAAAP